MKLRNTKMIVAMIAMLSFSWQINAQVMIADDESPKDFSLLELSTKTIKAGLRMPQLTTSQRDALLTLDNFKTDTYTSSGVAGSIIYSGGLMIFNMDTKKLEYWHPVNQQWVALSN